MRDWLVVILLALIAALLGYDLFVADRPPARVTIPEPVPVVLVAPVPPPGPTPGPAPQPRPSPGAEDTALARAGRDYLRAIPAALPAAWAEIADLVDRGAIGDKAAAVAMHNRLSGALNVALDEIFSAGIDSKGRIVNKSAISGPLRQSAAALGGHH